MGKKFSWNTIKSKVKYDKNRDDELIRRFAARKTDDENSIGRSHTEPDFNDSRAVDGINDDIIRISQYSIKSDAASIREDRENSLSNIINTKFIEKHDRQANRRLRNTKQKNTQTLNRLKKQYNQQPNKINNQGRFNRWHSKSDSNSISRILDHAETATTATDKFRLKKRGNINSRATKIEEMRKRLGISKPIIAPKNKEKIIHDDIKKKPANLAGNESRFKSNLKERMKIEILESSQQEAEKIIERQVFKPR
ncbi:hypothetical protein [Salmonella enterica]|uniref:hypothetical protein n=1 Tax=Salmonella enterica TaxID=28901 RepID=UPI001C0BCA50|nr:hypothetical protein [Salmonella enterica]